ncbi:hypothetical protein [Jeotgalibacillus proteolyticus]|uniref:hypothetical protein n=1 Tax=Jeotgalibacillus proteolyticus TaxID=2082395 RepID=UPI001ADA7CC6|nr:hypothetical protein [Jeotgalibacillus proteolyticus]
MLTKLYYDAKDVQAILGCGTVRTAYARIQRLNKELEAQGYWTESGKVPISFFHEKYPYLETDIAKLLQANQEKIQQNETSTNSQ